MLFKEIVDGRTDGRTDIEGSQKLTEHFVLRWAKKATRQTLLTREMWTENKTMDCLILYTD